MNYTDPSGHQASPYIYEKVCGQYWYHLNKPSCFGIKGSVEYAKQKTDVHLKKYKKAIVDERKSASKAQKMFGKAVLLIIIDYGTAKFFLLIKVGKISKKIPGYILGKIRGKVQDGVNNIAKLIVGGAVLSNARSGVRELKNCYNKHNIIKKEYKKIRRKKKTHF